MDGQVRKQKLTHRGVFARMEDSCLEAIIRVHQGQDGRFIARNLVMVVTMCVFVIFHLVSVPEH